MRPLLIVDTETTGLDPEKDRVIEVGAVLFETEAGVPVACGSRLISSENNPAHEINRIPRSVLWDQHWNDETPDQLLAEMADLAPENPIYVAQNADFDRAFLGRLTDGEAWICTKRDVEWNRLPKGTGSLVQIALAYDVGVVRAHRAIEDCLTLAAVLSRVHALEGGLEDWLARALEPRVELAADVSYDGRQLAKDRGFTWDPDRKLWVKRVRESQVETLRAEWPFTAIEAKS